jgi:hypothetical protein
MKSLFIAFDGTSFEDKFDCLAYEASFETKYVPTPKQLEERRLQQEENEKLKIIMLAYMEKANKPIVINDMMFDIINDCTFLRKRISNQRLSALMRQLICYDEKVIRTTVKNTAYFSLKG